jgi:hypothetical protein
LEEAPEEADFQLLIPWALYHFDAGQGIPAELALAQPANRLSEADRRWIEANQASWITVWEVQTVQPDTGLALRDLLTGREVFVYERMGSRSLVPRDSILARVMELDDLAVLAGLHPRVLPPDYAATVMKAVRRFCRTRAKRLPVDTLRKPEVEMVLLEEWQDAVWAFDHRRRPTLTNTDGELVVQTSDIFSFSPGDRAEVERRLVSLEEDAQEEIDDGSIAFTFTRPGNAKHPDWQNTITGRAVLGPDTLRLESNSTRRADELRRRVEKVCGSLLRYQSRDEQDQEELWKRAGSKPAGPKEEPPPELAAMLRASKERHYATWSDTPVPALGSIAPREAARRPAARIKLDLLLREMENMEARLPESERFDFRHLRGELGLGG